MTTYSKIVLIAFVGNLLIVPLMFILLLHGVPELVKARPVETVLAYFLLVAWGTAAVAISAQPKRG